MLQGLQAKPFQIYTKNFERRLEITILYASNNFMNELSPVRNNSVVMEIQLRIVFDPTPTKNEPTKKNNLSYT